MSKVPLYKTGVLNVVDGWKDVCPVWRGDPTVGLCLGT